MVEGFKVNLLSAMPVKVNILPRSFPDGRTKRCNRMTSWLWRGSTLRSLHIIRMSLLSERRESLGQSLCCLDGKQTPLLQLLIVSLWHHQSSVCNKKSSWSSIICWEKPLSKNAMFYTVFLSTPRVKEGILVSKTFKISIAQTLPPPRLNGQGVPFFRMPKTTF